MPIQISSPPRSSPASPVPQSSAGEDKEVNVAGRRAIYLLRRLSINCEPLSVPIHVSIEELKQRSDPRVDKYHHPRVGGDGLVAWRRTSDVALSQPATPSDASSAGTNK